MGSTDVTTLIGKTFKSEEVQAFVTELAVKPKVDEDVSRVFYDFKKAGVVLRAEPKSKRINTIFLYANKVDGYSAFPGTLPHGVEFAMDVKVLEKQLGAPELRTDETMKWEFESHGMAVQFDRKGRVRMVVVTGA